jgi:DNA adenine methylase
MGKSSKAPAPVIKPFLKWAGGKLRLVDDLKKKFPKDGNRFIEPFVGAGSVSLNVDYQEYIINDTNRDLMSVYCVFKKMGIEFVGECKKLFVAKNNTRDAYAALKDEFNSTNDKMRKATLFIYLNRHCFNGLCRYNGSGEFNTPIGSYDEPYFPEEEFMASLDRVKKFQIKVMDFREVFDLVVAGDVVYCDPPYLPLSESASFDDYAQGGFSLKDQLDLAKCASVAAKKGATVVISNHWNWYAREIYTKIFEAKVSTLDVSRTISCKTEERKPVKEVIAVFAPVK